MEGKNTMISIEDKENIVNTKDETTTTITDEETQRLLSDIIIDEDGNIVTITPQTPLKDITQRQHSSSTTTTENNNNSTQLKRNNSHNTTELEPQLKKTHFIHPINLNSSLEADYIDTLFQLESAKQVKHGFISLQPEITSDMRSTLVDWMSDVVNWVPYNEETFFLAVNYVDRYLSVRGVRKSSLQLLGIAALHTAGKYEEVDPPSCTMLAPLAGKRETCKRVNLMELKIGTAIDFDYNVATHMAFIRGLTVFDESNISTSSDIFTNAVVNK